ncbi:MAG: iron ABC transporter permease [Phycisphaerae bacterium]|nr:iron ABC transporter permease [Phycisphaerae bacterium]
MTRVRELTAARWWLSVCVSLAAVALVLIASLWIGTQRGELGGAIAFLFGWSDAPEHQIAYQLIFGLRLPRALLALIAGITLSMSGTTFQALLRNPLAEPYTLGVASGGALGALVALKVAPGLGLSWTWMGPSPVQIAAFVGSLVVIAVVYRLGRAMGMLNTYDLLLAGVTMALFCGAAMLAVQYFADYRELFGMIRWMMGSLETVAYRDVVSTLSLVVPAWIVLLVLVGALNQLSLGEEVAGARGVRVGLVQTVGFLAASLATGAVVAVCGPIGFVGLIVPHAVRMVVGPDHRVLLPCAGLIGGAFLVVCDWGSRLVLPYYGKLRDLDLAGVQLPIGVITALLGGPFFLGLLLRSRRAQRPIE